MPFASLEARREYVAAHRERINALARAAYAADPQRILATNRHSHYGITQADYDLMLVEQDGMCAICDLPMGEPCVDHSHLTGKVRALVCHSCNLALGHMADDPDRLRAAAQYLEDHA